MNRQYRLTTRAETISEEKRSVQVVAATENPVTVFDWERGMVDEVLLMGGANLPYTRQVPLLDSHRRDDTSTVIGSLQGMEVRDGQLVGTAYFSAEAERQWNLVRDGHLTDFSVGYRVDPSESVFVKAGETERADGREWAGPVLLQKKWHVKELSLVPIGADEMAKARAEAGYQPIGENPMNDKLKQALIARGMPADATEDQALEFLDSLTARSEPKPDDKPDDKPDVEKIRREATGAERDRIAEIDGLCGRHGFPELAKRLIADGTDSAGVRKAVLDAIVEKERNTPTPATSTAALVTHDGRDKFRDAAVDAIAFRAGGPVQDDAIRDDEMTGMTLREIARHSLRIAGHSTRGNALELVGRALTTEDFADVLNTVANRSLMRGWENAPETWRTWCSTGSAPDFLQRKIVSFAANSDLMEVKEGAPYRYGTALEGYETYQIATYGRMMAITRQAIINDDLGALSDIPMAQGEAAARMLGDMAYAVLTANSALSDGVALFAAGHGNLADGNVGAPSVASLDEAYYDMAMQEDLAGNRLNLQPEFLIAPVSLRATAEQFFAQNTLPTAITLDTGVSTAQGGDVNIYAGDRLSRVYDARLDSDSTTAWYLSTRRDRGVKVYFLNGQQTPYMETRNGWTVDGAEMKIRIDAGAAPVAYQGLWKNAGA